MIAIIQDNKLILKAIDFSNTALVQQGNNNNSIQTNNNIGSKIIQIQPTNNTSNNNNNNQVIINSNNIIQIASTATTNTIPTVNSNNNNNNNNNNIIQLLPKNELLNHQNSTFTLDSNQFNNINVHQIQNSNFNQMHKLAVVAAAAAAASSSSIPTTTLTATNTSNSILTTNSSVNDNTNSSYTLPELSQINSTNELILGAHKDTWPYLKEKCKKLKSQYYLKKNASLEQLFNKGLLQLLKDTKFLEFFNSLIENTVLFAKIVPYFMEMHETDRITLLKSSVFEIICIRHSQLFDLANNKLILQLFEAYLSK